MYLTVDQQLHGYKNGHQMLGGSIKLERRDQDAIDKLSDISGSQRPGEKFDPYFTGYPLPSRKFYVLACTKQDPNAPRAGCVLTKSFLIPYQEFSKLKSFSDILKALSKIDRVGEYSEKVCVTLNSDNFLEVEDNRVYELIEALFLEERQPILMLDSTDGETIAFRLLTALWPGMRNKFSFCTFALGPRSIDGHPFDLLFAPSSARSRFVKWPNRTIFKSKEKVIVPRHAWTEEAVINVFKSPRPNLRVGDILGVMESDESGDEAIYRLNMLWRDLSSKAQTSQSAVLGLLDIANSRDGILEHVSEDLQPLIANNISRSLSNHDPDVSWAFFFRLLRKLPRTAHFTSIVEQVKSQAIKLTNEFPIDAISFLSNHQSTNDFVITDILLPAISDGLSFSEMSSEISRDIYKLETTTLLRMIIMGKGFARYLMKGLSTFGTDQNVRSLSRVVNNKCDVETQSVVKEKLLDGVNSRIHAPILKQILRGSSKDLLKLSVEKVWNNCSFQVDSFDPVFAMAAKSKDAKLNLRTQILQVPQSKDSDRFLLNCLKVSKADIDWLIQTKSIDKKRCRKLLIQSLSQGTAEDIEALFHGQKRLNQLRDALGKANKSNSRYLAKIAIIKERGLSENPESTLELLKYLSDDEKTSFLRNALSSLFKLEDEKYNSLLLSILNETAVIIDTKSIIDFAINSDLSYFTLSKNLQLLTESESEVRKKIVNEFAYLNSKLIATNAAKMDDDGVDAWLKFYLTTSDAGSQSTSGSSVSVRLYNYLKGRKKEQISLLLIASYSRLYKTVYENSNQNFSWNIFSNQDSRECRYLRGELIDAFRSSNWPQSHLLLAGIISGDMKGIVDDLNRKKSGKKQLARAIRDVHLLPEKDQRLIVKEFDALKSNNYI